MLYERIDTMNVTCIERYVNLDQMWCYSYTFINKLASKWDTVNWGDIDIKQIFDYSP